ncbi:hypothetical protein ACIBCO_07510 [Streptomyces violascens]|uniref:hypothetical protein n=1 Tax=Streptomyces violascens TaxID=67381 RepID=UPI00379711B0
MGKASRKKRQHRARKVVPATSAEVMGGDPRSLGEAALGRLLRTNAPEKLSLAGAYAFGYMELGYAQRESVAPAWYEEVDPLDALFLGAAWPGKFGDEFEFANARDAWLRLLRGTVHGKGVERFVREVVSASEELALPVDDGELMLALADRLEAAGLDQRRLPRRLLPRVALQDCRAVRGPSLDLRLPDPPEDAKRQARRFWEDPAEESSADDTPYAVLREGLRQFEEAGMPVEEDSSVLLPALYAALLAKPAELLLDVGQHAAVWACSLDEASELVPVLDILLVAPEREISVTDTLAHLFAVPAFTEPIPSDALLWTSSPGLALSRLAFGLDIPKVSTRDTEITPDLLDWVGMHTRMHLSAVARRSAAELEEADGIDGADGSEEEADERWSERREALRGAALDKIRKKSDRAAVTHRAFDRPIERIWNADGSSLIRISSETPDGQGLIEDIKAQREAFREKFGRNPGPDDPLFFDPDADEPLPLSKQHFDDMMLEMAERAAEIGIDPAFLHAWREVGYVVTEENRSMWTTAEVLAFSRAVVRHREAEE